SSNNLLLCQRCYASPREGERAASQPQTGVPEGPPNVVMRRSCPGIGGRARWRAKASHNAGFRHDPCRMPAVAPHSDLLTPAPQPAKGHASFHGLYPTTDFVIGEGARVD